jgi:hypothetical protein
MRSGEAKTNARQMGSRDRQILDDIIRYRLINNHWILGRYLHGAKPNAAVKLSSRLAREGWITSHKLFQRERYFTAGPRLVRHRGLPVGRMRPLGTQALAVHYSALRYCSVAASVPAGTRLPQIATVEELKQSIPWLPPSFHGRAHVIDNSEGLTQWRLLRVDMGGRPDHVARKVTRDVNALLSLGEFGSLVTAGHFTQVVLCPSREKKRLIEQSLSDRPWPRGIRFQIGVIPELFQLLAIQ